MKNFEELLKQELGTLSRKEIFDIDDNLYAKRLEIENLMAEYNTHIGRLQFHAMANGLNIYDLKNRDNL